MLSLKKRVQRLATKWLDVGVLLRGEPGVGKEVIAKLLHLLSPRANKQFAVVNCPAIAEPIFESELFGHVKGAFTGATSNRMGKILAANGGTVFMDEIGDLPLTLQSKVLRLLQYK